MIRVKYLLKAREGIKIGPFGSALKLGTLTDEGIKIYGQSNVIQDDFELGYRHLPVERFDSEFKQYEILPGDVLVTMMGTTGKSKVFNSSFKQGILDSHLLRLRFKEEEFGSYLFVEVLQNGTYATHQIKMQSNGSIMEGLNSSIIKDLIICQPSLPEQKAILAYLDRKTAKIDQSIAEKQGLIDLFREERQAIINHAVTKGIRPGVKMKPSGVEWIGEVPEGWAVKRLKFLCHITTGDKDTENKEDEGEFPFFVRSQTVERISSYSFDGEAILTAGDGVGVGKVFHYYNGKFDFHQRVYKLSDFRQILGKYFFYYVQDNFHKEVMKISAKSTVDSLRLYMLQNFPVAFGDKEEQKEIVTYLDYKTTQTDAAISGIQQEIALLQEYRQALIFEAVTGKIDVRDAANK